MTFGIAVVQPIANPIGEVEKNVDDAVNFIAHAKADGADFVCFPDKLWAIWRNLIWSRAIENLAILVTTLNLFSRAERGLAMVAAPEEIVFERTAAGMFVVDVSLECARQMRASTDGVTSS